MKKVQGAVPLIPVLVVCPSGWLAIDGQPHSSPDSALWARGSSSHQLAAYNVNTQEIGQGITVTPEFSQFGKCYSFPTEPPNLTAGPNPGDSFVRLSWSTSQGNGITYEVWSDLHPVYRNNPIREWRLLGTTSSTFYVDQEWLYVPGGNFGVNYRVRAKSQDGLYSTYAHRYVSAEEVY